MDYFQSFEEDESTEVRIDGEADVGSKKSGGRSSTKRNGAEAGEDTLKKVKFYENLRQSLYVSCY